MDTIRAFFLKSEHFVLYSKKSRGGSPLVAHMWVWINKHQYPWISLNILENAWMLWLCQDSEYAWSSYMFNRVLKCLFMPQVLNVSEFQIWYSCICKGYTRFWICLDMAQHDSMPEYASICLNAPQYAWTWLNSAECPWICLKMTE